MTTYAITKLWIILTVGLIVYFYFTGSLSQEFTVENVNATLTVKNGTFYIENATVQQDFFTVVSNALQMAFNFNTPIGILNTVVITFYSLITATVVREWLRV